MRLEGLAGFLLGKADRVMHMVRDLESDGVEIVRGKIVDDLQDIVVYAALLAARVTEARDK